MAQVSHEHARPRILLITASLPYPPISGDQQRSWFLHRALANLGDVDVLLLLHRPIPEGPFLTDLKANCRIIAMTDYVTRAQRGWWRLIRPLAPRRIDKLVAAFGRRSVDYRSATSTVKVLRDALDRTDYDVVVGRYIRPTAMAGGIDFSPVMIDVDDVDTLKYERWIKRPGLNPLFRTLLRWHLFQIRRVLPKVIDKADHLWVASEADLPLLEHHCVSALPNLPYPGAIEPQPRLPPCPPRTKRIVFVGSSTPNHINLPAIRRFVARTWPRIREAEPDAVLQVVGGGWDRRAPELKDAPGVELPGFVKDLTDVYRDAAFAIVPLFDGAGTKIKVLEAASYGRAQVVAAPALRGFDHALKHEQSLLVASDEDQIVEHCLHLLHAPEERDRLGQAAWEAVYEHFRFERFQQIVTRDVEKVLRERKARKQENKKAKNSEDSEDN